MKIFVNDLYAIKNLKFSIGLSESIYIWSGLSCFTIEEGAASE